jgi:1-acyl-sn-glycerol-3-phosphate acyltransferase
MHRPIFEIPVLNFIFRVGEAIPICSRGEDEAGYQAAMETIAAGLVQGDLLAIFPEGKLTADGDIAEFRRGIERILERTPVPVVPMALRGLWGSFFSRCGGPALTRPFRRFWSRVVVAAPPLQPTEVTAAGLRKRILALRGADG